MLILIMQENCTYRLILLLTFHSQDIERTYVIWKYGAWRYLDRVLGDDDLIVPIEVCGLQQRMEMFSVGGSMLIHFNTTEPPKADPRGLVKQRRDNKHQNLSTSHSPYFSLVIMFLESLNLNFEGRGLWGH